MRDDLKLKPQVELLEYQYPWVTAVVDGRWVQAKVFNEPSEYGISDGRISKLYVLSTPTRDTTLNFLDQCVYAYDRGDCGVICSLNSEVITSIVTAIEGIELS